MAGLNKFKSNMELYLVPAGDDYVADDNHQWFDKEEFMEDCIIRKWKTLPLSEKYNIVRRQYPTDTGKIDILAISKDKKELLVIELKKGKSSDAAVGQVQRYMGYITVKVAKSGQRVSGVIIAKGMDKRIQRALVVAQNIQFYCYGIKDKKEPSKRDIWGFRFFVFLVLSILYAIFTR